MKLARKTNGLNCSETGNMCLCMSSTECQVNKCNALQLLVELCFFLFVYVTQSWLVIHKFLNF